MDKQEEIKMPEPIRINTNPALPKWIWIAVAVGLITYCLFFLKDCKGSIEQDLNKGDSLELVNAKLKAEISEHMRARDSLTLIAKKKDSVRIELRYKYLKAKEAIGDPYTVPADTAKKFLPIIIAACDSTHKADSLYIGDLRSVISQDSTIISTQAEVIRNDSTIKDVQKQEITALKAEVRKQKRQKRASLLANLLLLFGLTIK